jgi:hypothetical protein
MVNDCFYIILTIKISPEADFDFIRTLGNDHESDAELHWEYRLVSAISCSLHLEHRWRES